MRKLVLSLGSSLEEVELCCLRKTCKLRFLNSLHKHLWRKSVQFLHCRCPILLMYLVS
ncbi:hypothetical protein HanRHA438_Chr15g0693211 [Helianthus annuus]|nr:hypothetical protein HanRHA438_Chr15g0693211 [Helianthus annuus]